MMRITFSLSVIFFAAHSTIAALEGPRTKFQEENHIDHTSYRLPKEVVPVVYDLWIYTRLGEDDFAYDGKVSIALNVLQGTDRIIVHRDKFNVLEDKSRLYRRSGNTFDSFSIEEQRHDPERQFHVVVLGKHLEPGEYVLELYFEGEVIDDVFGFYRSSYVADGETKWIGVTQFSPTHARRAFPCMDEPHLKAHFILHIGHDGKQRASSNTPMETTNITDSGKGGRYFITSFAPTPRMSTYLVGWAVHDFVPEPSRLSSKVFMWTRDSMNLRGTTALTIGHSIYAELQKWLLVENPIAKMDHFAIPDFHFQAMENWGMITFRESVVLFEEGVTPTKNVLRGLTTVAHEYAHTWFGNLVTPRFWDVAWLKEGFASYFQYFALGLAMPSWRMMDMFVVDYLQPTLLADSVDHNRTMNGKEVGSPASIIAAMDFVTYRKGASVIRMLKHVIGDEAFKEGLQNYQREMAYKAAAPEDVYRYLQAAFDKLSEPQPKIRIADVMDSWTTQPGYPLITVQTNHGTQKLEISQQRFHLNREKSKLDIESSTTRDWWVPLNFAKKPEDFLRTGATTWLRPGKGESVDLRLEEKDWIILNVQQVGYYRVNYDENNWRNIIAHLVSRNLEEIHVINRAALLDDAFNLARAGYLDYSVPFDLSKYLIRETEYEPWLAAVNSFNFLNQALHVVPQVHQAFQVHVAPLLQPMYKRLDFIDAPSEEPRSKLHRELILTAACSVNNEHCLRTSKALFQKWISAPEKTVFPDAKSFVYCLGVRSGDADTWHTVWERFLLADLHTEQELLLNSLGCTADRDLIHEYLNASISLKHGIRKQYRATIVNAVLNGNPTNVNHVLEFLQNNLGRIIDLKGNDFLNKILSGVGDKVTTNEQLNKLRVFINDRTVDLGSSLKTAKRAIETSTANLAWIKEYSPKIAKVLA
ncbi:hypothetical protein KM043_010860 [Ampulex compressa]|nr:hypothetical protein KM043_010860 [Ampulex compressa]